MFHFSYWPPPPGPKSTAFSSLVNFTKCSACVCVGHCDILTRCPYRNGEFIIFPAPWKLPQQKTSPGHTSFWRQPPPKMITMYGSRNLKSSRSETTRAALMIGWDVPWDCTQAQLLPLPRSAFLLAFGPSIEILLIDILVTMSIHSLLLKNTVGKVFRTPRSNLIETIKRCNLGIVISFSFVLWWFIK